jgi:CheY-like chemotaxis protein
LSLVKQLVESHGGSVSAFSAGKGHGTTFTVRLPIHDPVAEAAVDPLGEHPKDKWEDLAGVKVLIVEDDPASLGLISRIIGELGAEIATAETVDEALSLLDQFWPDVLISDLGLPGQDGYDLIRQIRSRDDGLAALPAVALTAFARTEDRKRALQAGFQEHIAKPLNTLSLLQTVAGLTRDHPRGA